MPRFHNPLGGSLTEWQKRELVRLAEAYDVYLVEDDFLGDLEDNQKADPLYAYDLSSRVIYLKSFSKMIFPGRVLERLCSRIRWPRFSIRIKS